MLAGLWQGLARQMRLITIRHRTTYRYYEPVTLGEHRMMFRPRESHDLRIVATELHIGPCPVTLRWLHDVFDNSVAIATFSSQPCTELTFESTVTLEHIEAAGAHVGAGDARAHVGGDALQLDGVAGREQQRAPAPR